MKMKHAPEGGEEFFKRFFSGGEFLPFYIPRPDMPQIDYDDYGDLFSYLKKHQDQISVGVRPPKELRAHQRIIRAIAENMDEIDCSKPVLVSSDDYILDGNHRWFAHVLRGTMVPTIVVNLPFEQALNCLCHFPKAYFYGDGKKHPYKI